MPRPKDTQVPAPWDKFLGALDEQLPRSVSLECLGGFVMSALYGFPRPTSDVDFLSLAPKDQFDKVIALAGQGSPLHKKYGLYLQHVGIANVPEDYENRLQEMFPNHYKKLRLFALDRYDLALSKLERNAAVDRDDVKYLAKTVPLDPVILRRRYEKEMRPNLANVAREDFEIVA
jgi:uncharacterized nucleotidyltransferase DUF6036